MGNNYKSKAERLKGDPYIGVCFQALETLECLCLIQTRVNYCQTKAWILTSFWPKQSNGEWIETKEIGTSQWSLQQSSKIKQEQLILAQGEDSKKGQVIYLTWKGSFQVILHKMIRFLSGKLKKHTKLAKIVKITEIFNRWVFPLNFNRFCHPMTYTCIEIANGHRHGGIHV